MSNGKKRSSMGRAAIAAAAASVFAAAPVAHAVVPDTFAKFFFDSGVAIGGFAISPDGNTIYKANFSPNQGFTQWNNSGGTWTSNANNPFVGPTDMTTFEQSNGLTGSGSIPPLAGGGLAVIGGMVLNPASITINRAGVGSVTYAPGTLAFVMDSPSNVTSNAVIQYDLTKIGYFYDLRRINSNNTASGDGTVDRNSNGVVDWNDTFETSISRLDARTVAGYSGGSSGGTSHRPAFSSNGQFVYFDDQSAPTVTGGLWKMDLSQTGSAGLSRILTSTSGFNTDPTVIASSVRNFGGGSGDQIVVVGSDFAVNPNDSGVSYVVDNGSSVSTPKTLLTPKQIRHFVESGSAITGLSSFTTDGAGNLYIADANNGGVYKYDANGNLTKVFSRAEQYAFVTSPVPSGGAGSSSVTTTMIKTSVRDGVSYTGPGGTFNVSQFMYPDSSSAIRAPVGVYVFKPGDFDRNNVVDAADIAAFKTRLGLRGAVAGSILTASPFTQASADKFLYDLNGSFATTVGGVAAQAVAVDWKDWKIFEKFANLSDGDIDMDGDVDTTDLTTMGANYGGTSKLVTQGNLASARIAEVDKDDVNFGDLVTLAASWTAAKPALAAVGSISSTDIDRAFAITANGTISEYVAVANGTWSNSANWSNATVPNGAGSVASLLTKPTNDATITIDSSVTLGQLNFDHYFSYAIEGGGILRMNGNGPSAEINTFAASPTISVSTELQTATNVTVTYAVDTLTISSNITGSGSLAKAGAGRLLLSGSNSYGGTTTANAGTLQATKAAALPGYDAASKIFVNNGGTLAVNANGFRDEWTTPQIDSLRSNGTFAAGSQLGIDTSNAIPYSNFEYASNIGGALGITKLGGTTVTLGGSNTYGGNTIVSAGTLAANSASSLPGYNVAGKVQVASGATLAVKAGGGGQWSSGDIDTLRANATLPAGATLAIDTTGGSFTYGSVVSGAHNLAKIGGNTATLTAANTYTGSTQVNAGTLQLDFNAGGAPTNHIIATGSALQMGGGTLLLSGKTATANAQTVSTTTFNPGASAITLTPAGGNLALTLGAITRNVGSTVEITLPGGTQSATNGVLTSSAVSSGILPATLTVGKTDWAGKSGSNVVALATYTNDAWASANNVTVTTSSGVAADATTNSLRFNAAGANTVTLAGTATISSGGLLVTPNVAANTSTITGGTLRGRSAGDLVIHQHNTAAGLSIASNLGDNNGSGVTKSGAGVASLTGAMSYTGATTVNAGTLAYQTNLTSSASVNVTGGKLELADGGGSARVIKSGSVAVNSANGGKLDLRDNKLITATHIGGWNGNAYDGITGLVASGRNGGVWDGAGITTSMSDATSGSGYTVLGVATGSEVKSIAANATGTWGGQTVTGTDTLVMYTYGGDANLSGDVDVDDYGQIDFNASSGGVLTGWYNGDFDYNGFQDVDDYGIIDFVVGIQGAAFPTASGLTIAAVPEPASIGLIAVGAVTLLRRRRRA